MPNVAAGTVWNLPNYTGELFTADMINTPLLSMIGGLTGGVMTENFEFPTDSQYAQEALGQVSISETASLTAPTPVSIVRTQNKNVTQIFQKAVSMSYAALSNGGRMSGINTAGDVNNVLSEKDFQKAKAIEQIAREVEWAFLNGTYQLSNGAGVANQTRGLFELAASLSTVDGLGGLLTKDLMDAILLEMSANGAQFKNMVIFCNGFQKQMISNIYGYAPMDRIIGGVNIKQIETDFGNIAISMPHRMVPASKILLADVSVLSPVFQPVPGKGNFFYEDLAKAGASESGQVYGQIGLDHGPAFMHGSITNLKTSK